MDTACESTKSFVAELQKQGFEYEIKTATRVSWKLREHQCSTKIKIVRDMFILETEIAGEKTVSEGPVRCPDICHIHVAGLKVDYC